MKDNVIPENSDKDTVSMESLAASTIPAGFSELLTNIDSSLACARETINESLSQSSDLLRKSMLALTSTPLSVEAMDKGSKSDVLCNTESTDADHVVQDATKEPAPQSYLMTQKNVENSMIDSLKKTEAAIEQGIRASHEAQIEMQKNFQKQFEQSAINKQEQLQTTNT